MIEQYIGKSIRCPCGKTHRSRVELARVGQNVIEKDLIEFLKSKDLHCLVHC